jgi:hypothetical protein
MGKISPRNAAPVAELDDEEDYAPHRTSLRSSVPVDRDAEMRPEVMPEFAPVSMTAENYTYERPNSMAAPPPRPGMVQRWVRTETRGAADPTNNYTMRLREGYQPRPGSSCPPEYRHLRGVHDGIDMIRLGSMILCEKPEGMAVAKRKYINDLIALQNQSVQAERKKASDEGLKAYGAPLVVEETESVSRGRRPATMVS